MLVLNGCLELFYEEAPLNASEIVWVGLGRILGPSIIRNAICKSIDAIAVVVATIPSINASVTCCEIVSSSVIWFLYVKQEAIIIRFINKYCLVFLKHSLLR
jgi:hypothetical protein